MPNSEKTPQERAQGKYKKVAQNTNHNEKDTSETKDKIQNNRKQIQATYMQLSDPINKKTWCTKNHSYIGDDTFQFISGIFSN